MAASTLPPRPRDRPVSCFWSGDTLRSRSVGDAVLSGHIGIPALPARLLADWDRDVAQHLELAPGDVESLPLARARTRWPEYRQCVQAASSWARAQGLQDLLAECDIALMACRGARFHHDGAQYGSAAFCNLFVSEDKGLDVVFPHTGHHIPLARGTVLLFDTCQPHAVVRRGSSTFDTAEFLPASDSTQVFLTWELPIEHPDVARALGVVFDIDPASASALDEEQVRLHGARASVCPQSGRWQAEARP
jgi:hypothetical protein